MKTTTARNMIIGLAAVLLSAGQASAAVTDYQWLPNTSDAQKRITDQKITQWKTTGACAGCYFTGLASPLPKPTTATPNKATGLQGAVLTGLTLAEGMDLSYYNLKNSFFNNCTLKGVNFTGAYVDGATFQDAKFLNGTFNNVANSPSILENISANALSNVDFTRADMKNSRKPVTWPALSNLESAQYVGTLTCDDGTKGGSKGGCFKRQQCPSPKSGKIDSNGNCLP